MYAKTQAKRTPPQTLAYNPSDKVWISGSLEPIL